MGKAIGLPYMYNTVMLLYIIIFIIFIWSEALETNLSIFPNLVNV